MDVISNAEDQAILKRFAGAAGRKLSLSGFVGENKKGGKNKFGDKLAVQIEHAIFDLFKNEHELVNVGRFLQAMTLTGIRKNDPRLREMLEEFNQRLKEQGTPTDPVESLLLTREQFERCISANIVMISRVLRNKLVIPDWQSFCEHIADIFFKCQENDAGRVANYIPQLARVNSNYWACSIVTVDGQRFSTGDTNEPFCIQSGSKTFNYALALNDLGAETVHEYVGQEPSGRIFNELALDYNNKPHNPMINAGAICTCSLIKRGKKLAERYDYVLKYYKKLTGYEFVGFNNAVFLSERDTADRNFALAYYMRENHCFPEGTDLHDTLDLYFQLCSIDVTAESGAIMAATLANGGICPTTDEPVLNPVCVRDVLSLMYSCGMYDYSGQFAFKIGLPAKSGVSGVVFCVIPNVMGICLWSPKLDRYGNSVRGVHFCEELVKRFNFHNYDNLKRTQRKLDPRRRDVETKGQQVVNILFSAANGDVTAMRRYLLQGVNLNMADYDARTALHLASAEGHFDCVRFLLERAEVDATAKDRWGHTALDEARTNGHDKIEKLMERWISTPRGVKSTISEADEFKHRSSDVDINHDSGHDTSLTNPLSTDSYVDAQLQAKADDVSSELIAAALDDYRAENDSPLVADSLDPLPSFAAAKVLPTRSHSISKQNSADDAAVEPSMLDTEFAEEKRDSEPRLGFADAREKPVRNHSISKLMDGMEMGRERTDSEEEEQKSMITQLRSKLHRERSFGKDEEAKDKKVEFSATVPAENEESNDSSNEQEEAPIPEKMFEKILQSSLISDRNNTRRLSSSGDSSASDDSEASIKMADTSESMQISEQKIANNLRNSRITNQPETAAEMEQDQKSLALEKLRKFREEIEADKKTLDEEPQREKVKPSSFMKVPDSKPDTTEKADCVSIKNDSQEYTRLLEKSHQKTAAASSSEEDEIPVSQTRKHPRRRTQAVSKTDLKRSDDEAKADHSSVNVTILKTEACAPASDEVTITAAPVIPNSEPPIVEATLKLNELIQNIPPPQDEKYLQQSEGEKTPRPSSDNEYEVAKLVDWDFDEISDPKCTTKEITKTVHVDSTEGPPPGANKVSILQKLEPIVPEPASLNYEESPLQKLKQEKPNSNYEADNTMQITQNPPDVVVATGNGPRTYRSSIRSNSNMSDSVYEKPRDEKLHYNTKYMNGPEKPPLYQNPQTRSAFPAYPVGGSPSKEKQFMSQKARSDWEINRGIEQYEVVDKYRTIPSRRAEPPPKPEYVYLPRPRSAEGRPPGLFLSEIRRKDDFYPAVQRQRGRTIQPQYSSVQELPILRPITFYGGRTISSEQISGVGHPTRHQMVHGEAEKNARLISSWPSDSFIVHRRFRPEPSTNETRGQVRSILDRLERRETPPKKPQRNWKL